MKTKGNLQNLFNQTTQEPKEKEPSEHVEQRNFVSWFRKTYPGIIIHSIPNGATLGDDKKSRQIRGNKLKLEGMLDGVPDLEIPEWYTYIEMKTLSGKLSKEQKEVIDKLKKTHTVLVCNGCDDAMEQIKKVSKEKGWLL